MSKRLKASTSSAALTPIVLYRYVHLQKDEWGVALQIPTPLGEIIRRVPNAIFTKREKCLDFLDQHGFLRPSDKRAQEQLHDTLVRSVPDKTCRLTSRLGWHGSVYVRPFGNIGWDSDEEAGDA